MRGLNCNYRILLEHCNLIKNNIQKDYSDHYRTFENRNRFEVCLKYKFTTSKWQACAMCYTTTTQTRGNLPFDTRAHTCLVSQNDKEKRKQKCYGLTSAREFLRKYAHV